MIPEPYEYTVVIKNNIPEYFSGTALADQFGYSPLFIRDNNGLKVQWQLFYNILEGKSGNKLFEFKTATNFILPDNVEDEKFCDIIYSNFLVSVSGFNWHFERNKSYLTMGKQYLSLPSKKELNQQVQIAYQSVNILN
ncbi:MAG: hypothetical protein JSS70_05480 [Bacteroidetes bacterium]|nr:hypothetical protein [Bacteroidota bacterium]